MPTGIANHLSQLTLQHIYEETYWQDDANFIVRDERQEGNRKRDMVLILNFDDACTRAIARGLRAEHVYCKIVPGNIALEEVRAQQPLGVILSGGVAGGVPGGMDMGLLQEGYPLLAMGDTAAML